MTSDGDTLLSRFNFNLDTIVPNYRQVIQYPRVMLLSVPEFDCSFSYNQIAPGILMTFVHLDVYYWSPSVYRQLKDHWPIIRKRLPDIIFTQGNVSDQAKFDKFVQRFGWKPLVDCICTDGSNRPIFYQTT
jgi:hypothetical protein